MPRLSCWLVRCALLYLVAGFSLGAWMLMAKALSLAAVVGAWRALHAEVLMVGWLIQLAMGVSYWILPRLNEQNQRGYESRVWAAFGTLNTGIALSCVALWTDWSALLLTGRVLEASSVLLYASAMLPRLRRLSRLG